MFQFLFFCKQKTSYEMRISDWSSDVCSSDLLTGKYRGADDLGQSARGHKAKAYMAGKGPAVLAAMDRIAAQTGATLSQIALAWVAAQPGVTAPIASATSPAQLDEIMGSLDVALTEAQMDALTEAGRGDRKSTRLNSSH